MGRGSGRTEIPTVHWDRIVIYSRRGDIIFISSVSAEVHLSEIQVSRSLRSPKRFYKIRDETSKLELSF